MTPTWIDDTRFRVDGVDFACSFGASTVDRFCIRKPRRLVEATVALLQQFRSPRIVELGIAAGGSTALCALAARPSKLVALELATDRVDALDALIARRRLGETVRPHYGVDQGDRMQVAALLADDLGDEPLDLVIDDASHLLDETRASFETMFPRLRPGGLYVIEDWNWQLKLRFALARGSAAPDPDGAGADAMLDEAGAAGRAGLEAYVRARADGPPLETLALELVLARACSGDAVARLQLDAHWVVVERGTRALDPASFRLADCYVGAPGLLARSTDAAG